MCWLRLDGRVMSAAGIQRTATPCLTSSLRLSLSVPVSLCPCLTSSRSLSLCIAPYSAWIREWGWWVFCVESEHFFMLQLYFYSAVLMVWLGLNTKTHFVRFWKRSCFDTRYLFWSPKSQQEILQRSVEKHPVVTHSQMLKCSLELWSLALASLLVCNSNTIPSTI